MRLVQISDMHIFAETETGRLLGLNTAESFNAVLDLVLENAVSPDMIILSGDLSQDETERAYEYIAEACQKFSCPIYWIPGNHDAPALMEKTFSQARYKNFKQDKAILLGDWLLVLLNTHYPNRVAGLLSKSELSRLDYYLAQHSQQYSLVFTHHHPIAVGSKWLDNLSLQNSQEFLAIIDQYPLVRGLVCGHVHQAFETYWQGVRMMAAPSTCIQFKPLSEYFALDNINPGYRWFDLHSDGSFKTGIERLKAFKNTANFDLKGY